jgi:glycosyltransferase involved in cell wall biosynthesis
MISTDRLIFDEKSAVRARQVEYAKDWEEVHIIIFSPKLATFSPINVSDDMQNSRFDAKPLEVEVEQGGVVSVRGPHPHPVGVSPNLNTYSGAGPDAASCSGIQIAPNCWIYSTESFSKYLCPFDAIKLGRQIIPTHKITDITCQDASLTAMAGVALKKRYNVQLEIQIHEDLSSPYYTHSFTNKIRKRLAYRYLPKANKVRVVSERLKDFVAALIEKRMNGKRNADRYRLPEIEVRPIAVDTKSIKSAPVLIDLHRKYRQFDKIVLMASRFEKEKNIELAIGAWPKVIESIPRAGLLIVGDGSLKSKLKAQSSLLRSLDKLGAAAGRAKLFSSGSKLQASGSDVNSPIVFEDWVDKPTLISYYKTADLFLNTSLSEGYGMTLVEAHAAGSKIISTDVGIAREVGATIIENDVKDVAKKVIEMLQC